MSDMHEMWSLPWHALQKALAGGIGAQEVPGGAIPGNSMFRHNTHGRATPQAVAMPPAALIRG